MGVLERWVVRNPARCDGTPKIDRGFRPHVVTEVPKEGQRPWVGPFTRVHLGPIFVTEVEAQEWMPNDRA